MGRTCIGSAQPVSKYCFDLFFESPVFPPLAIILGSLIFYVFWSLSAQSRIFDYVYTCNVDLSCCRIMDKHLKSLATSYLDAKFIKVDAEVCFCETYLSFCTQTSLFYYFHYYQSVEVVYVLTCKYAYNFQILCRIPRSLSPN